MTLQMKPQELLRLSELKERKLETVVGRENRGQSS